MSTPLPLHPSFIFSSGVHHPFPTHLVSTPTTNKKNNTERSIIPGTARVPSPSHTPALQHYQVQYGAPGKNQKCWLPRLKLLFLSGKKVRCALTSVQRPPKILLYLQGKFQPVFFSALVSPVPYTCTSLARWQHPGAGGRKKVPQASGRGTA